MTGCGEMAAKTILSATQRDIVGFAEASGRGERCTVGVLICSYRRPSDLSRGLEALAEQERRPDDVIIVARETDGETLQTLEASRWLDLPLRVVVVSEPGTVHALNAGLSACRTDVLAVTDDDTVAHRDWLRRIEEHFVADPKLGGLGGRDWNFDGRRFDCRQRHVVGRLQWFGRTIGNHHLGAGGPREVNLLKGANMSYRAAAFENIRFDRRLRGQGAQPWEDAAFSMAVGRAGWKVLYDPMVAVDHYLGRRDEPRHYANISAVEDASGWFVIGHNEIIALWPNLSSAQRVVYVLWSFLVGTGVSPGFCQAIRYWSRLGRTSWRRFRSVQMGKLAALRLVARGERKTSALGRNDGIGFA